MGDSTRQRAFIVKSTTTIELKHQYKKKNGNRSSNNAFFLSLDGTNYRVCKLFFMVTQNVGNRTIRTTLKKGGYNKEYVEGELRGNRGKQKKLSPDIVTLVTNHIN
ncbi:Uncharacterized protein FWK35_00017839 [Aphis craccivora]|uniref:Uncharacterized protein n=1 Tax=Aphis craccivora TaxID=307492 RepID=A0A6G0Y397_APHCR|nr:Uncharacterized protein FWK35_00017839 [Aphis craccivora]